MRFSVLLGLVFCAVVLYVPEVSSSNPISDPPADVCFYLHFDEFSCNADDTTGGGCIWCKCTSFPSACFTIINSQTLPPDCICEK